MSTQQHELQVKGMSCQHCVKGVTRAIQEQDPQAEVQVDLPSHQVTVQTSAPRDAVVAQLSGAGYAPAAAA